MMRSSYRPLMWINDLLCSFCCLKLALLILKKHTAAHVPHTMRSELPLAVIQALYRCSLLIVSSYCYKLVCKTRILVCETLFLLQVSAKSTGESSMIISFSHLGEVFGFDEPTQRNDERRHIRFGLYVSHQEITFPNLFKQSFPPFKVWMLLPLISHVNFSVVRPFHDRSCFR